MDRAGLYRDACWLVSSSPTLACLAALVPHLVATLRAEERAALRPLVRARYRHFTQPGAPDGPRV